MYYFIIGHVVAFIFFWLVTIFIRNYKALFFAREIGILFIYILSIEPFIAALVVDFGSILNFKPIFVPVLFLLWIYIILLQYHFFNWLLAWPTFFYEGKCYNIDYFVLYLRSFNEDKFFPNVEYKMLKCFYRWFCTFEIGRPNEFLPNGGAVRIFVGENWKERVLHLMKKAPIIILRVSTTENFLWEFSQCIQNDYLFKTIFWIESNKSYEHFRITALKYNLNLPICQPAQTIIYFENGVLKTVDFKDKTQIKKFIEEYTKYRNFKFEIDYFAGRGHLLSAFFRKRKLSLPQIDKWSNWAFFFPSLYIITHHFKWRGLWYLLSFSLTCFILQIFIFLVCQNSFISSVPFDILSLAGVAIILKAVEMYYMGKSGNLVVWLNEKWESMSAFNNHIKRGNQNTIFLVVVMSILFTIGIYFYTSNYDNSNQDNSSVVEPSDLMYYNEWKKNDYFYQIPIN